MPASRPWFLRPPWRTFAGCGLLGLLVSSVYVLWSPALEIRDGRHDRGNNAIWIGHGWLGDDTWFARNMRKTEDFRSPDRIATLVDNLGKHRIRSVFPHCCPCTGKGELPPIDGVQATRLLDAAGSMRVIPWIGGTRELARIEDAAWRKRFCASTQRLLTTHPRFAGVQLNIEPLASGDPDYLLLLDELRVALPVGKVLSIAAYPPPTMWQPEPSVHWDETYMRAIARRCDELVVMGYDTGIQLTKVYQGVLATWTRESLAWAGDRPVWMGIPAYDDAGVRWHNPKVENLSHALPALHAGLSANSGPPANWQGVAVYCEWEMGPAHWAELREQFLVPQ